MKKKVLVISSSLRAGSNSELMAKSAAEGAASAGHEVSFINLKEHNISYCKGCLSCQSTGKCIIRDDMDSLIETVNSADMVIIACPVYYYSMPAQLKAFLDRCNPLYIADYRFRDFYLLTSSAEEGEEVYKTVQAQLEGWIECFPKARLAGVLSCGGITNPKEVGFRPEMLSRCFELGKSIE